MKIIITILVSFLVSCQNRQAKSPSPVGFKETTFQQAPSQALSDTGKLAYKPLLDFANDSIAYLKYNFLSHKSFFIGRPFSVLRKKLEIKPANILGADTAIHLSPGFISDITVGFTKPRRVTKLNTGKKQFLLGFYLKYPQPVATFKAANNNKLLIVNPIDFSYLDSLIVSDIYLSVTNVE